MSSISANVTIPDSQDALPSPSPVLLPESFIPSNKTKREASDSEHSELGHDFTPPLRPRPPANKSKGGRPSHTARISHRTVISATPPPPPPPPQPKKKKLKRADVEYSPRQAMIIQHAIQSALPTYSNSDSHLDDNSDMTPQPTKSKANHVPKALNNISHAVSKGWSKVGECHTMDLHKQFDEWHNDFTPNKYEPAEGLIERQSFGHPVDRPQDLRARPFIIKWITEDGEPPRKYETKPAPVLRVYYKCTGNCHYAADADVESMDSDEEAEEQDSSNNDLPKEVLEEFSAKKKVARGSKCVQKVQIHVEVMSDDLSKVLIWQCYRHPAVANIYLAPSNHVRQTIAEYASLQGMTAGRIKRRLTLLFKDKSIPHYRRHTSRQVNSIVSNVRRKDRLIKDPLLAIEEFAQRNPDKIFRFDPPDMSTNPPSGFATGIKARYALQALLLYARRYGVGLDSTWRHMNENRAPVTFVTTLDSEEHMVPGPVYISSDVTADTIILYLSKSSRTSSFTSANSMPFYDGTMILQKHMLLYAVRELQRCRFDVDWGSQLHIFSRRVAHLSDGDSDKTELIMAYFSVNWFTLEWRDHWTDIGLPSGQTREGMLSTNNWTERAFKTFHPSLPRRTCQ
ncbi:hypothetical protein FIBSPDRAFT_962953 [Athelia psychrophila]|uniref:Uncharacterized protein n=1 Tax=Athelia psychrophila TaxID=1759441 RepID=A0A165ZJ14_9AGAM|nr:hypothetical protein FIBSPDRAFT_962953 [Fibularhizoctonia sp. CBS 109695]